MEQITAKNPISYFGITNFRNQQDKFGIRKQDRLGHLYLIGKTGTGKSTLISNLLHSDLHNNEGCAIIDPHGDLADKILSMVPPERTKDVTYFNPGDSNHTIQFNPLEIPSEGDKYLVASSFISIMKKMWLSSWGPRLEHILRHAILTILEFPELGTLLWIPKLLTDKDFRKDIVGKIYDRHLLEFWHNEFEQYSPRFRQEAISPILNKISAFLSNPHIRRIFERPKSNFSIPDIMNDGKIFIANLSKGSIGEDNSSLLGAMLMTSFEQSALARQKIPEDQRRDFYLYADEFPSYTTESFTSILSEARKYKLSLNLAHQHISQLDDKTRGAIFGNVGTIISFRVGAEDAKYLADEFYPEFTQNDLVNLPNYNLYLKLMINGVVNKPFSAKVIYPLIVS